MDNDPAFFCEAGRLRAFATSQRLAISLADCFCIATARALGADVLTCDHREFDAVIELGTVQHAAPRLDFLCVGEAQLSDRWVSIRNPAEGEHALVFRS